MEKCITELFLNCNRFKWERRHVHLKMMLLFSNVLVFKRKEWRLVKTKPNTIFPPVSVIFSKRNWLVIAFLAFQCRCNIFYFLTFLCLQISVQIWQVTDILCLICTLNYFFWACHCLKTQIWKSIYRCF